MFKSLLSRWTIPLLFPAIELLSFACPHAGLSQSKYVILDTLPGARINAVSADGKTVVGYIESPNRDTIRGFRWTQETGIRIFSQDFSVWISIVPTALSADGSVVVGYAATPVDWVDYPFRWTDSTGMVILPTLSPPYGDAIPYDCSADGSVLVGFADPADRSQKRAVKWEGGILSIIGEPPPDIKCNNLHELLDEARGVSGDGTKIIGKTTIKWCWWGGFLVTGGGGGVFPMLSGQQSDAYGISGDGNTVAGSVYYELPPHGSQPCIWRGDTLIRIDPLPPLYQLSYYNAYASRTTFDGSVVLGQSNLESFLWTQKSGTRPFKQAMLQDHGLKLDEFDELNASDISSDGHVIVAQAYQNAQNYPIYITLVDTFITVVAPKSRDTLISHHQDTIRWTSRGVNNVDIFLSTDDGISQTPIALNQPADSGFAVWTVPDTSSALCRIIMRAVGDTIQGMSDMFVIEADTFITVLKPMRNDRWITDESDTIRWNSKGVKFVNIFFSADSGNSKMIVALNFPADSGYFPWKVPNWIYSAKCRIFISDAGDTTVRAESGIFRIKGTYLTRSTADGQYEPFDQLVHGYWFGNENQWLWPESWWKQFNYRGVDPVIGSGYPVGDPFLTAVDSQFIDWPLFVRIFGESECYWLPSHLYKVKAITKWGAIKGPWNGSCSGFSLSSLLAFDDKTSFRYAFPEMPDFTSLYDLNCNDSVRSVINQLWAHYFGTVHKQYINARYNSTTPTQTVKELREMFLNDTRNDQYLYIANNGAGGGAHAIVPYKLEFDSIMTDVAWIYVYDNSYPNDLLARIMVDTSMNGNAGRWSYSNWPGWGGDKRLFLMDPVNTYLTPPVLPKNVIPDRSRAPSKSVNASAGFEIFGSTSASVLASDSLGRRIGYRDSLVIDEMPNSAPIMPPTGHTGPPLGYTLPAGGYVITMDRFTDSTVSFTFFGDSVINTYSRRGVVANQTDKLYLGKQQGLTVVNGDVSTKRASFKTIVEHPTAEKVFEIYGIDIARNDSMIITPVDRNSLLVSHTGGSTTHFDLVVEHLSAGGGKRFSHPGIPIDGNSGIEIMPSWETLGSDTTLKILIDRENDGTFDDSLFVRNEATGVRDRASDEIPGVYALMQNYPNPFNSSTIIAYQLPVNSFVTLRVYDVLGREIETLVNGPMSAGRYDAGFDGSKLATGLYFYHLKTTSIANPSRTYSEVRRMLLIK